MFIPAPFVPFSTAQNLQNHLVQSKLYPLQHRTGRYTDAKLLAARMAKMLKNAMSF